MSFSDFPGCITAAKTLEEARNSQMDEIDRRARREGMTRSVYIVAAALMGAKGNRSRVA